MKLTNLHVTLMSDMCKVCEQWKTRDGLTRDVRPSNWTTN